MFEFAERFFFCIDYNDKKYTNFLHLNITIPKYFNADVNVCKIYFLTKCDDIFP